MCPEIKVVVLSSKDEFTPKEWEVLKIQMCKACTIADSLKNCKFCSFNSLKIIEAEKALKIIEKSPNVNEYLNYPILLEVYS